jgi:uncharacterized membrane protein
MTPIIPRRHIVVLLALLLLQLALAAVAYPPLPNPGPVHWDRHGRPDGFGSPLQLLAIMPIASFILLAVLLPLARVPGGERLGSWGRTYGRILIVTLAALTAIHVIILLKALGAPVRIEVLVPCAAGLMVAAVGNWMGKVRRNRLVGVRTPWTLASDAVWERTNRLGGRLLVAFGLLVAAVAWLGNVFLTLGTILAGSVALIVWAFAYSKRLAHRLGVTTTGAA